MDINNNKFLFWGTGIGVMLLLAIISYVIASGTLFSSTQKNTVPPQFPVVSGMPANPGTQSIPKNNTNGNDNTIPGAGQ